MTSALRHKEERDKRTELTKEYKGIKEINYIKAR